MNVIGILGAITVVISIAIGILDITTPKLFSKIDDFYRYYSCGFMVGCLLLIIYNIIWIFNL